MIFARIVNKLTHYTYIEQCLGDYEIDKWAYQQTFDTSLYPLAPNLNILPIYDFKKLES